MTSIVDSKAHLQKRCTDMGMSQRAIVQPTQNNLDTMGKLAFSIGQPGQPLDSNEFENYARNTLGAMMSQADAAVLKRLIFEGHTLVLGQLRELVSGPDAAASRKLPAVEREHRLEELRRRLVGVVLARQLEPSHELLELMMQQKEANQLNYIQLERCTSREWEITMGQNKKQLSLDSEKLIVKERADVPDQFHSSELQAFEALWRRGIAMAFADILSWECHERYLQQLASHLRMDPPQNYVRPSLQQVLKADRQVFMYLIRVGAQLKRLPDNTLDLDQKLFQALQSYEVGFHLLPLPKTSTRPDGAPAPASGGSYQQTGKGGNWQQQRSHPYKGKGNQSGQMAKASRKVAKAFCQSSFWAEATQTWIHVAGGCASIIKQENAQKRQMVVSALRGGTCAAGRIASRRIQRKTMIQKRNDDVTASGPCATPVRLCKTV